MADISEDTPVNPAVDPEVPQGAGEQPAVPTSDVQTEAKPPENTDGYGNQGDVYTTDAQGNTLKNGQLYRAAEAPEDIDPNTAGLVTASPTIPDSGLFSGDIFKLGAAAVATAAKAVVGAGQARNQETISNLSDQMPANTDWRVVLRLAPGATYLYKTPVLPGVAGSGPGLLAPLAVTNGVIFPYTPTIGTAYKANYETYDLTHSNYRGYFYKNSYIDAVSLKATFTAQSTADAAYVLAVIHFFRSVTKMFYGQDAQRGSPPPLVFLSGLGDYQFNNHPCVVTSFSYNLPPDVDYISSGAPGNPGLNLQPLQNLYSTTLNAIAPTATRLAAAFLPPGAQNNLPAPLQSLLSNPTYVPSKIDIDISLLPVQTRQQVSKTFSLRDFANGSLIKKGFW